MKKLFLAGLSVFTLSFLTLSTVKAIEADVNLEIAVDAAIAMTIHSSSDDNVIYGTSNPEPTTVGDYETENYTAFGTSSAKTRLLPNSSDTSMFSIITVYTNATNGYKLTVNDADNDTSLNNGTYSIPAKYSISAGTSAWSYKGGLVTNFTAMSTSPTVLDTMATKTPAEGHATTITYGVSTSGDQATGTYTDTIVYTATALVPTKLKAVARKPITTPSPVKPAFFTISSMQEMTPEVCMSATTPNIDADRSDTTGAYDGNPNYIPEHTLVDSRDGNSYKIRKFADGSCWMVDELKLRLNTAVALTSADTDLNTISSWTPTYSTLVGNGDDYRDRHYPQSYDANNGTGVYYNQAAAMAEDDISTLNIPYVAPNSICPKGWKLFSSDADGESVRLLSTYGLDYNYSKTPEERTQDIVLLTSYPFDFKFNGKAYTAEFKNSKGEVTRTIFGVNDVGQESWTWGNLVASINTYTNYQGYNVDVFGSEIWLSTYFKALPSIGVLSSRGNSTQGANVRCVAR